MQNLALNPFLEKFSGNSKISISRNFFFRKFRTLFRNSVRILQCPLENCHFLLANILTDAAADGV